MATLRQWIVILAILLVSIEYLEASEEARQTRPPNIVLIISDDQAYTDFGFMGNRRVQTPHLDELARRSAQYPRGYVPSSVCRPSLMTLLTGLYPHQHGVHFNHPPPGFSKLTRSTEIGKPQFDRLREQAIALVRNTPTFPRILASHGYRCLQTGKHWEGHFRDAGFTDGMTIAQPSGGKYGDKQLANGDWVAHGNGDHGLSIGRQTMQPIEDFLSSVDDAPFMIWYAPFLPHTPHDAPKKFTDRFTGAVDVAEHELPYFAAIAQLDDTVGALIGSLQSRGIAEQTLIVFVVDNGWRPDPQRKIASSGQWDHIKKSKRSPFDVGLRTPILLCWPGKTSPAVHRELVSTVDLVPTLLAAAGIEREAYDFPGENLWPSATGRGQPPTDRAVFGEIYPGDATAIGAPHKDLAYRWVRRGRHKLIVPHARKGKSPWNDYVDSAALYDVVSDPDEQRNLIAEPGMAGTAADLREQLDQWWLPE